MGVSAPSLHRRYYSLTSYANVAIRITASKGVKMNRRLFILEVSDGVSEMTGLKKYKVLYCTTAVPAVCASCHVELTCTYKSTLNIHRS